MSRPGRSEAKSRQFLNSVLSFLNCRDSASRRPGLLLSQFALAAEEFGQPAGAVVGEDA